MADPVRFDPGSFRDPSGRVFFHRDQVFRTLNEEARCDLEAARAVGLLPELERRGLLLASEIVTPASCELDAAVAGTHVLRQPRVPLVSYAYEWSFEMLRDAAVATLEILDRCLAEGFTLKDANSFNVQFVQAAPKLVDVPSIARYEEGSLWAGYGQFCRSFLFPLLITATRGIDFQPLLSGSQGELPAGLAASLMRRRDWLRPGVLKDVVLQARLERSLSTSAEAVGASTRGARYPKEILVANVGRLLRIVRRLKPPRQRSTWERYADTTSYSEEEREVKHRFVENALASARPARLLDLGCNTGEYTDLALAHAKHVIAVDSDARSVDHLYLRHRGRSNVSPLVASIARPTPPLGWRLAERRSLAERLHGDFFLALALVHHLRIGDGIPLGALVSHLFELAPEGIVEWVDKADPMVRKLLGLRPDVFDDYTWERFEALLRQHGTLAAVRETHGGNRRLCHVKPRSA